jgi:hypothetical protein
VGAGRSVECLQGVQNELSLQYGSNYLPDLRALLRLSKMPQETFSSGPLYYEV